MRVSRDSAVMIDTLSIKFLFLSTGTPCETRAPNSRSKVEPVLGDVTILGSFFHTGSIKRTVSNIYCSPVPLCNTRKSSRP